jgi:outer membrane protein assembly factor BamD
MQMRKTSILSILAIVLLSSCSQLERVEKSNDYQKKLAFANQLYQKKKYSQAHDLYQELLKVFKGTGQFEELNYKYAYCAYYMEDYTEAAFDFKNFVDYFPNSPRAAEMDFMDAYCFYKLSPRVELDQSNTIKAIGEMQEFINDYPESDRVAEANKIIDECQAKLELKEYKAALLYYNLGYYNAAAISFKNLMIDYPDADKSDEYKYMIIKSEYLYALNSIPSKQVDRYDQVITDYLDFNDHYPKSQYAQDAQRYYSITQIHLKNIKNEQNKKKFN